jgi:uncharacterized protein GlcG (DUF336 family)
MLTLAEANQAIAAALARARHSKMEIAVNVCDEEGVLLHSNGWTGPFQNQLHSRSEEQ